MPCQKLFPPKDWYKSWACFTKITIKVSGDLRHVCSCFKHDQDLLSFARKITTSYQNFIVDKQLLAVVIDLFSAGTETTTTTLRWAFVYLLHHPDVLQKVQHEIDSVIGQHRPPCWNDRNSMPYTEAVIKEVFRRSSIVPNGLIHTTTSDVVVCGHNIPKGAWMMPDIYNIHHDSNYWKNPEVFDPTRFLESSESKTIPLIPFSTGMFIRKLPHKCESQENSMYYIIW